MWDEAHAILSENARTRANRNRARTPAPLKGLLRCGPCDRLMSPTHTRRHGRLYRYYVCAGSIKNGAESCPVRSVSAAEIEGLVLGQVRRLLQAPEMVSRTVAAYHELAAGSGTAAAREREVLEALGRLEAVWEELFPAEQTRILRLLVERVEVAPDGLAVCLRTAGIGSVVTELIAGDSESPPAGTEAQVAETAA